MKLLSVKALVYPRHVMRSAPSMGLLERAFRAVTDQWWLALVVCGVAVRILAGLFVSNTLDMRFYGLVMLDGTFHRPLYQDGLFSYPPLWGYVLLALGRVASLTHVIPFERALAIVPYSIPGLTSYDLTKPLVTLLIKAPIALGDAGVAWCIWSFARELGADVRASRAAVLAWWINPVVLFGSAVNASWDCIVPLAMLSAVLFAWRRAWFASGIVIALGILAKLTPLYAIVIVAVMAASSGRLGVWMRRMVLCGLGMAAALLVGFAPVLVWGEGGAFREAVFARMGSFSVGGVNLWSISALHAFAPLAKWAQSHRSLVLDGSLLAMLAGIVSASFITLYRRARDLRTYLLLLLAVVSIILMTSPFSQPTYIVWTLPIAILLAVRGGAEWRWYAALQTLFAAVFLYSVRSVFDLLMPLCVFTHVCDPVTFAKASLAYRGLQTPLAYNLQVAIDAIAGFAVGITILWGFVIVLRALRRSSASGEAASDADRPRIAATVPALFALGAAVVVATMAMAPFPQAPNIAIYSSPSKLVLEAHGFDGPLHVVRFGAPRARLANIYVYFDNRYPYGRGVGATFRGGFAGHLRDDLHKRQDAVSIVPIDARGLARLLKRPGIGSALIVLDGMLPATLRDAKHDPLQQWLRGGGVVFWAGGPFGVLYAKPATGTISPANTILDYRAWRSWYADGALFPKTVDPFRPPVERGQDPSIFRPQTNVTFARTTFALNVGPLLRAGGTPLGLLDDRFNSSVSVIPYGDGRIVFFGDGFDDEIVAAMDISQIIASNAWDRPRDHRAVDVVVHGSVTSEYAPLADSERVFVFGDYPGDGPFVRVIQEARSEGRFQVARK